MELNCVISQKQVGNFIDRFTVPGFFRFFCCFFRSVFFLTGFRFFILVQNLYSVQIQFRSIRHGNFHVAGIQFLRNNIPVVKRSHHLPAAGNLNGIFLGFADSFQSIGDFISGNFAAFIRCLFAHSIVLDHRALFVPGSTVGHGVYKILSGQELSLRKFAAVIHPVPILGQQRFIIIPRHFLWGI